MGRCRCRLLSGGLVCQAEYGKAQGADGCRIRFVYGDLTDASIRRSRSRRRRVQNPPRPALPVLTERFALLLRNGKRHGTSVVSIRHCRFIPPSGCPCPYTGALSLAMSGFARMSHPDLFFRRLAETSVFASAYIATLIQGNKGTADAKTPPPYRRDRRTVL